MSHICWQKSRWLKLIEANIHFSSTNDVPNRKRERDRVRQEFSRQNLHRKVMIQSVNRIRTNPRIETNSNEHLCYYYSI